MLLNSIIYQWNYAYLWISKYQVVWNTIVFKIIVSDFGIFLVLWLSVSLKKYWTIIATLKSIRKYHIKLGWKWKCHVS